MQKILNRDDLLDDTIEMKAVFSDVLFRLRSYGMYRVLARSPSDSDIRSPRISEFTSHTLENKEFHADFGLIRKVREKLMERKIRIPVNAGIADPDGAQNKTRTLRSVVQRASVYEKHGKLLYLISKCFKPSVVIELGTSTGLSTLYLALGHPGTHLITVEADPVLCGIASDVFQAADQNQIDLMNCTFDEALSSLDNRNLDRALIFIDGNHTYEATRKYFEYFMGKATEPFVLIFHDIYWSRQMCRIWNEIKSDPKVKTTIDLYYMGIVCNFRHHNKQNLIIRY
ncbi:MAG: class I SAM-dependent methyltransferase [Bacteroidales bacterium]|nr:class I SAM-dependent methyltransferase [Bacteroidales bacterium]